MINPTIDGSSKMMGPFNEGARHHHFISCWHSMFKFLTWRVVQWIQNPISNHQTVMVSIAPRELASYYFSKVTLLPVLTLKKWPKKILNTFKSHTIQQPCQTTKTVFTVRRTFATCFVLLQDAKEGTRTGHGRSHSLQRCECKPTKAGLFGWDSITTGLFFKF